MSNTYHKLIALLSVAAVMGLTACDTGQSIDAGEAVSASQHSSVAEEAVSMESAPVPQTPQATASKEEEEVSAMTTASEAISLEGRRDEAASRFGGMSCVQALASTYADLVGLDEDAAMNLASGFGLGMGRKETCGAVTVMTMYAGLGGAGEQSTDMIAAFEDEMGSVVCQDFLDEYGYGNCTNCIRCAAGLLETRVFGEMPSQNIDIGLEDSASGEN